ncbi:MAG: hypothetical protein MZW92_69320 [Comamonadaceae bacterium]|nr:hypothetical protein [Comamonadaceae bacterium]
MAGLEHRPGARHLPLHPAATKPTWAMKLGLSTNLGDSSGALRPALGAERHRASARCRCCTSPASAQWSPQLAARLRSRRPGDRRAAARSTSDVQRRLPAGRRSMSVFGGYQLTDAAGEAEGYYGTSLSNRANIGLRYRF